MNGLANKKPVVSIVMPAYNAEKYIGIAIESILNQTFSCFELLIIDDGSTDKTWEIIKAYAKKDNRIVSFRNSKNLSICRTLNFGIRAARGQYIARMDADDWSYPKRLEKQIEFMKTHSEVVLLGNYIEICDDNLIKINIRRYKTDDKGIKSVLLKYIPFGHPTVMYVREAALKCGLYDPNLFGSEDYDFYFRISRFGKFANLPESLFKLRTHEDSISQKKIHRQTWLTLYIKIKAVVVYGYQMSFSDKVFFLLHFIGNGVIPVRFRFWFFNFLRKYVFRR